MLRCVVLLLSKLSNKSWKEGHVRHVPNFYRDGSREVSRFEGKEENERRHPRTDSEAVAVALALCESAKLQ